MAAPVLEETSNSLFLDAMVRHQIYLSRFAGHVRNSVLSILDKSEQEISERIQRRLINAPGGLVTTGDFRRLDTLLGHIRRVRSNSWGSARAVLESELVALASAEVEAVAGIIQAVSPVVVDFQLPSARQLRAIAVARPFQGRTLREWAKTAQADDIRRISDAVRTGMVIGDSNQQIARRVIGTQSLKGRDGATQITRRAVESITRTATNHISNAARTELFRDNADILGEEQFVATLDVSTTLICASLDGKRFPVGKGPQPPLHFRCRSLRVAVIDGEIYGERPMKTETERRLLREFSESSGTALAKTRDGLPRGSKAEFDKFSRRRVRELTGRVPAKTTYTEFLSRQSVDFQNDVLGPTRAKLFRDGKLPLDRFVNRAGDEIPLSELKKKHAKEFEQAGLSPAA